MCSEVQTALLQIKVALNADIIVIFAALTQIPRCFMITVKKIVLCNISQTKHAHIKDPSISYTHLSFAGFQGLEPIHIYTPTCCNSQYERFLNMEWLFSIHYRLTSSKIFRLPVTLCQIVLNSCLRAISAPYVNNHNQPIGLGRSAG